MKKFMFFWLVIFSIFLLNACGKPLQDYQPKNETEKEIKNLLIEFAQARNNHSVKKMASCYTDTGQMIIGRRPIPISEFTSNWKDSDLKSLGKYKFVKLKILIKDNIAEASMSGKQGLSAIPFDFKLIYQNNRWKISELVVEM